MSDMYHHRHNLGGRALRIAGVVLLGVVGTAIFALVFGVIVMLLWNWLMPSIFHIGEIGFWQAFGIIILAKLIFGGLGTRGRSAHHGKPSWAHGGSWKKSGDYRERWRYWREFWEEEGHKSFDSFVQRKKEQTGSSEKV